MNFTQPVKTEITTLEKLGLFFLILGHTLAAYYSFGFHHPDEHFQIWEWANYYVGLSTDVKHLPWEYLAQIRPWLQPFIHVIGIKILLALHLFNPFSTAFIFRFLYSTVNVISLWTLWRVMKEKFQLAPIWFVYIGALWFLPYIHARTSSENLAGIFLTFAFAQYLKTQKMFTTGLLFGFAFVARYQIALGLVGFGIVLLLQDRAITKRQFKLLGGFLIPVAFGVVLDRIGYGNWVFTPYRYFSVNLVQGVAATFNPYPWYQYFIWILQLNPLISIPISVGLVLYYRKAKFEELGSFVAFFFILHCFITNKEYRFFFPVLNLVPFMAAVGLEKWQGALAQKKIILPYAVISLLAFTVSSMRGASVSTIWALEAVNRHVVPGETWLSDRNYNDHGLIQYYTLPDHELLIYHTGAEFNSMLATHPHAKAMLDGNLSDPVTLDMKQAIDQHCKLTDSAYPMFVYHLRDSVHVLQRVPFQATYQCE